MSTLKKYTDNERLQMLVDAFGPYRQQGSIEIDIMASEIIEEFKLLWVNEAIPLVAKSMIRSDCKELKELAKEQGEKAILLLEACIQQGIEEL